MSSDHPEYGEDRIALELELKFGILHSTATIRKYRKARKPGPRDSQTWRTFLKNQAEAIWTSDFLVHYTLGFRVLHVFVLMELGNRKVIHGNVTEHPTLDFVKQQVRNACRVEPPKFLIHDNDGKYGQLGHPIRLEKSGILGFFHDFLGKLTIRLFSCHSFAATCLSCHSTAGAVWG